MEKTKAVLIIAFIMLAIEQVKAQQQSEFVWVPFQTLEIKKPIYNREIPIYAVALKKVEESKFSKRDVALSEKPNGEQSGYYGVDSKNLSVSIREKKGIKRILFGDLQKLADGWRGVAFDNPLYIVSTITDVLLKNIRILIKTSDYEKLPKRVVSAQNDSQNHQMTAVQRRFINELSFQIPDEKNPTNERNNDFDINFANFTTPEKCGYTLIRSSNIEGIKCDHYLENVRTFRLPNGDFVSFKEGEAGYEDKKPFSTSLGSVGDWKFTKSNGAICSFDSQKNLVTVTYPNGTIVKCLNPYHSRMTWDKIGVDRTSSLYGPYLDRYLVSSSSSEHITMILPDHKEPLRFVANGNIHGFFDGYRLYNANDDGLVYPTHIVMNGYAVTANANDSILSISPDGIIRYANGDAIKIALNEVQYMDIESGTIHRNGGVLTVKEANGRSVKLLTFPNGDKYVGEFKMHEAGASTDCFYKINSRTIYHELSYPELIPWNGTLIKADGKSIQYINGKTEQQLAAERQAQKAKTNAQYNALCKKYGKKFVDSALNQTPIVGMPEELLKSAFQLKIVKQSGNFKLYRIYGWGWTNFGRTLSDSVHQYSIWVRNGRVTSVTYWGD